MRSRLAIALLVIPTLLGGCAGTAIGLRSTNSPSLPGSAPPLGSFYSSAAIQVDVTPGALLGLMLFGYLVGGVQGDYQHWSGDASWRKPPQLAGDRAIAERDCSRPMEPTSANLRCK